MLTLWLSDSAICFSMSSTYTYRVHVAQYVIGCAIRLCCMPAVAIVSIVSSSHIKHAERALTSSSNSWFWNPSWQRRHFGCHGEDSFL